jgi:hypothetical protein
MLCVVCRVFKYISTDTHAYLLIHTHTHNIYLHTWSRIKDVLLTSHQHLTTITLAGTRSPGTSSGRVHAAAASHFLTHTHTHTINVCIYIRERARQSACARARVPLREWQMRKRRVHESEIQHNNTNTTEWLVMLVIGRTEVHMCIHPIHAWTICIHA